jgi:LysR family nitrogen assimilation transcriptional regulator
MLAAGRIKARRFARPGISSSIAWVHIPRRIVSAATKVVVDVIQRDLVQDAASARKNARDGRDPA